MSYKTKAAILLLALFITFAGLEIFVQATSADEILKLARRAGDHRLFSIQAQAPIHHVIDVM